MAVEVDQSGRVEDLSTGTAVAFSNDESGAVFVSAGVKRRLIVYLRKKSLIPVKDVPAVFFSILLFVLIEKRKISILNIDEEYTGKNAIIVETIEKLFVRERIKRVPNVRFMRIGKLSPAHVLAWRIHRSKGRSTLARKVSEQEILKFIQGEEKAK